MADEDLDALTVAPEARELAAAFTAIINAALAPEPLKSLSLSCQCSIQVAVEDLAALPVTPQARALAAAFAAIINAALAPEP